MLSKALPPIADLFDNNSNFTSFFFFNAQQLSWKEKDFMEILKCRIHAYMLAKYAQTAIQEKFAFPQNSFPCFFCQSITTASDLVDFRPLPTENATVDCCSRCHSFLKEQSFKDGIMAMRYANA